MAKTKFKKGVTKITPEFKKRLMSFIAENINDMLYVYVDEIIDDYRVSVEENGQIGSSDDFDENLIYDGDFSLKEYELILEHCSITLPEVQLKKV